MSGYVALLDVLGFKSIITGDSVDKKLQEYLQTLEEATKTSDGDTTVNYVVFSDSIVLTTGDSVDSFKSTYHAPGTGDRGLPRQRTHSPTVTSRFGQ